MRRRNKTSLGAIGGGTGGALGYNGPRAKKSLGQNFLQDKNIAAKIVAALDIQHDDNILEIGPGPGALSGFILKADPAFFAMLEKDRHWAAARAEEAGRAALSGGQRAQVILGDAMEVAWERFSTPWKFIGNLPYNIASPMIWDLVSRATGLKKAVFMVQKEVAERLAARAGTGDYGALSAWVQSFAVPKLLFTVPPQVFIPRPKVMSAVVSFSPLPLEQRPDDPVELAKLLTFCFQRRRKQAQNIFKELIGGIGLKILIECGVEPSARPENFSSKDFQKLSKAVRANRKA